MQHISLGSGWEFSPGPALISLGPGCQLGWREKHWHSQGCKPAAASLPSQQDVEKGQQGGCANLCGHNVVHAEIVHAPNTARVRRKQVEGREGGRGNAWG